MKPSLQKKYPSGLAGALIITHLAAFFFAPWFHQHPGEDHAEVKGGFYHSHVSAFASQAQEFEQDHHDLPDVLHLLEGAQLFEKMQAAIAAHFGQIIAPGKLVPQIDFFGLPSAVISPPKFAVETALKLPPVQPTQDYFVLIATGLSPPLA